LYFRGKRYGHLTSNIAEAFNAKLLVAWEMPILAMLEEIRQRVMGWFASRRLSEDETPGGIDNCSWSWGEDTNSHQWVEVSLFEIDGDAI
jgi:hypothetical protein